MPSIMCWDTSGGEETEDDDDDDEAEDDNPKSWNTLFLLKLTSKHLKKEGEILSAGLIVCPSSLQHFQSGH